MKLSVIVPVYNCDKHLPKCIDSILSQSFKDFELILVNDGSKDNSLRVCELNAEKDSRVKVINKANGGVSAARNEGLSKACGEYIVFIDADDYVGENFFKTAYETITKNSADLYISGHSKDFYKENQISFSEVYTVCEPKKYTRRSLLSNWGMTFAHHYLFAPWAKFYKNSIIKENNIKFDHSLSLGEDLVYNIDYLKCIDSIYFDNKYFYHYCVRSENSLFTKFHGDYYESHLKMHNAIKALIEVNGCSSNTFRFWDNFYFSSLLSGIHESFKFSKQTDKTEKLNLLKKISSDKYVNSYSLFHIIGIKNKIFYILLKKKRYNLIMWLFEKKYKRKVRDN